MRLSKWNTIEIDRETMATNIPGVFAGGDVVTGPGTVLEAMHHGKIAAESIHRYLNEQNLYREYHPTSARLEVPLIEIDPEEQTELHRPAMPKLMVEERRGNFKEVELGLSEKMAVDEAKRCLRCDLESLRLKGG